MKFELNTSSVTPAIKAAVKRLWNALTIKVTFRKYVAVESSHAFLGYADLEISGKPGTIIEDLGFYLNGVKVKVLKNGPYLETRQEKGKVAAGENAKYWNIFAPGSAATRLLLTMAVFRTQAVKEAMAEAEAQHIANTQAPASTGDELDLSDEGESTGVAAGADPFAE